MMRAMVVDDSRAMRSLLRNLLKSTGLEVVAEAGNGIEALAALKAAGTVDVALVDWNMPEMNGYEFIQAVRADDTWAALRIIMVTTESEIEKMTKALEAGANEYIMKPFTKDAIRDKLQLLGVIG
jgi:two-component system, chemotaxis family, chemotaxis protein CheY